MKKTMLAICAGWICLSVHAQEGHIVPTGLSQDKFLQAYKLVLSVADESYHSRGTAVDEELFPSYGEHSVYRILQGSSKGSFVIPRQIPGGYAAVNTRSYSGYDWKEHTHHAIGFNRKKDRVALFKSGLTVNENSVTWEAMYFKNLFSTYLYPDMLVEVDEEDIAGRGLGRSTRILVVPSFSFKEDDGLYYPDQAARQAAGMKMQLDSFLMSGGTVYAEGNAIGFLKSLGYMQDVAVDFSNTLNSDSEGELAVEVSDASHPAGFSATAMNNALYSGTVPEVKASAIKVVLAAADDGRPLIFEYTTPQGGKILCNLGLPTAGGMSEERRQLQWTLDALLYGLSSQVDITRRVENELPGDLTVGRNAISFDRIDTFQVKVLARNLSGKSIRGIQVVETFCDYFELIEVNRSPGSYALNGHALTFRDIALDAGAAEEIVYTLRTPHPEDPIHEDIDKYLSRDNLLAASFSSLTYARQDGALIRSGKYQNYAEVMFSARIFADTDVNWKNFLGMRYQPFKVFMNMENKQRTSAEEVVYTQYIPKDVPFYWSDGSLNIPILKTPGGKFIDVLRGSNDEDSPDYDMDSDGDPDVWLDTASIYPKGYTIEESEVYWANPWNHLKTGDDAIVFEDIDHDGRRAQDTDGDGVVDIDEPGDKIRVWKVTWEIGEVDGYQYYDPYCSYEIWVDPPNLIDMAAGIGYAHGEMQEPLDNMFYPYAGDIENANLSDTSWKYWMMRDESGEVDWKQLIFQRINNYQGYTFIDTAAVNYRLKPTDRCPGNAPQPHNEFIAVLSLGGEEIDMYHPTPSSSRYSKIDYKTIFNEKRVTPIRTTYTYWAPLPNPLQFEYLSNNFIIKDPTGKKINYLPSKGKADITFEIDATTEYTYYWIRNVGYDVDFNDPSQEIDGVDSYGDGVFGYFIYTIPRGMGGYSITLPKNEDGSYNIDSIIQIDNKSFERWIDNPNTGNRIEIWEDPFEYHVYVPQILIPPALDDDNFDGVDDWIDDRGDRFSSETGFLHDGFMPGDGEEYLNYPAEPFQDDIYGMVDSGWYAGPDETYGDDYFEKLGNTHISINAQYEGEGREGSLEISKGGILVVEEIFGGSPWVIFSHVLSSFARGTDIQFASQVVPSNVRYGKDTTYLRHMITDEKEPHQFDIGFDPYHLSYGHGECAVTTIVGGKDPCSLIEPSINTSSIIDPSRDQTSVTLVPDPDPSIPALGEFPKEASGTFVLVRIEVNNGTDNNWKNTTLTPVVPGELGSTRPVFSYVAYPRPLVPGDDVGTFEAGWRFNQPEGEVLVKPGNNLNLLQPSRRGYFVYLFKMDENLQKGVYTIDFEMKTEQVAYTGESQGSYEYEVPQAMFCVTDKNDAGRITEFQDLVIDQASLGKLTVNPASNLDFIGDVKWSVDEPAPEDFDAMTNILATGQGGAEMDLSVFESFPSVDTTTLYLMQKVGVNSLNRGEKLKVVHGESLEYTDAYDTYTDPHGPLYVYPVGPRISISKRIEALNGYPLEDTLMFEPDGEILLNTLFEVTNTGNDISSNTRIEIRSGKFYKVQADRLPEGFMLRDSFIVAELGSLVPGETKEFNLFYLLKHTVKDKTALMELIRASEITYEGTSIPATYGYSDEEELEFRIHDFQLFGASSMQNGNQVLYEVTAVNRGVPASDVHLRVYPVVGGGIAELPHSQVRIDSFDTYQEHTLKGRYTLPEGEEVEFLAVIDDGDDIREVFEVNNQLRFDGGSDVVQGIHELKAAQHIVVHPNPFSRHIRVAYTLAGAATRLTMSITSLEGKRIDQVSHLPGSRGDHVLSWTASDLPRGIYILHLEGALVNGETINTKVKMVKQ